MSTCEALRFFRAGLAAISGPRNMTWWGADISNQACISRSRDADCSGISPLARRVCPGGRVPEAEQDVFYSEIEYNVPVSSPPRKISWWRPYIKADRASARYRHVPSRVCVREALGETTKTVRWAREAGGPKFNKSSDFGRKPLGFSPCDSYDLLVGI